MTTCNPNPKTKPELAQVHEAPGRCAERGQGGEPGDATSAEEPALSALPGVGLGLRGVGLMLGAYFRTAAVTAMRYPWRCIPWTPIAWGFEAVLRP